MTNMTNSEKVILEASAKGRADAKAGRPYDSGAKPGSMWDKYYSIGYRGANKHD